MRLAIDRSSTTDAPRKTDGMKTAAGVYIGIAGSLLVAVACRNGRNGKARGHWCHAAIACMLWPATIIHACLVWRRERKYPRRTEAEIRAAIHQNRGKS